MHPRALFPPVFLSLCMVLTAYGGAATTTTVDHSAPGASEESVIGEAPSDAPPIDEAELEAAPPSRNPPPVKVEEPSGSGSAIYSPFTNRAQGNTAAPSATNDDSSAWPLALIALAGVTAFGYLLAGLITTRKD